MIFTEPVPFQEALDHEQVKRLLPNLVKSRQLALLPVEVRRRARFSAGVADLRILGRLDRLLAALVSPDTVIDEATGERRAARPGEYVNQATFRRDMTQILKEVRYSPRPEDRGTIKDLLSTIRQDLISDTNLRMADGYGNHIQGQDEDILDQWPAQEFFRAETRNEKRPWPSTWDDKRMELGAASTALPSAIAMIALKNDPIWRAINYFGLPYAPFHFNSGMDVRDIDRDTAISLKLIDRDTRIAPATLPLNDDLSAAVTDDMPPSLIQAVLDAFGGDVELRDGRLVMQEAA